MDKFTRFFKTAGIFFLGNVITKLMSFLLLPLYTNKIEPDLFGEYSLVLSLTNLVIPLIFLQIWDSVFRFSFDYSNYSEKLKVINDGFLVMVIGSVLYTLMFFGFIHLTTLNHRYLVFLYSLLVGLQYFFGVIARSLQNNKIFVFSGVINSLVTIILNILLILVFNLSVEALYLSSIAGIVIQIFMISYKTRFLSMVSLFNINKNQIKKMLQFSFPLSVSTIAQWLLTGFTQVFISFQIGSYYNGLFSVANKFSSLLVLLVGVFQFAWNEMAYMLVKEENNDLYYSNSIREIFKISVIGSSLFILFIKIMYPFFINEQYYASLKIIPILMLGTTFNTYSGFLGTIFLAEKKSNKLFSTTLGSALINVIGLLVFTPRYGLNGAAVSLAGAFLIGAFARLFLLKKMFNISLDKISYLSSSLLFLSIYIYYRINNNAHLIILLILVSILGFSFLKKIIRISLLNFKNVINEKKIKV